MKCIDVGNTAPKDRQWMAHNVLEAAHVVIETSRRSWALRPETASVLTAARRGIRNGYASAETNPERTANRTSPGTS